MTRSYCSNGGPLRGRRGRAVMEMISLPSASRDPGGARRALPIQRRCTVVEVWRFHGKLCMADAEQRRRGHTADSVRPEGVTATHFMRSTGNSICARSFILSKERSAPGSRRSYGGYAVRKRVSTGPMRLARRAGRSCAAPMTSVSAVIGQGRFRPVALPAGLTDRCGSPS